MHDEDALGALAEAVFNRRLALRLSQAQLAAVAGTSERTIRLIEKAERSSYQATTLRALSQGLGWTAGSAEDVLAGGKPRLVDEGESMSDSERYEAIERRLANVERLLEDLRDGQAGIVVQLSERRDRVEVTPELLELLDAARGEEPGGRRRNEPA